MKPLIITLILLLSQIQAQDKDSTQIEIQRKIFIGLTLADIATTGYGLSNGAHELNPLLPDDIVGIAIVKIIVLFWSLDAEPQKKELWLMNIVTSIVVINNAYQIGMHQRRRR